MFKKLGLALSIIFLLSGCSLISSLEDSAKPVKVEIQPKSEILANYRDLPDDRILPFYQGFQAYMVKTHATLNPDNREEFLISYVNLLNDYVLYLKASDYFLMKSESDVALKEKISKISFDINRVYSQIDKKKSSFEEKQGSLKDLITKNPTTNLYVIK